MKITPKPLSFPSSLGSQIRLRRKELKITQSDLATIAEISLNTLYKIERGQANPSLNTLSKVLEALGLDITLTISPLRR